MRQVICQPRKVFQKNLLSERKYWCERIRAMVSLRICEARRSSKIDSTGSTLKYPHDRFCVKCEIYEKEKEKEKENETS